MFILCAYCGTCLVTACARIWSFSLSGFDVCLSLGLCKTLLLPVCVSQSNLRKPRCNSSTRFGNQTWNFPELFANLQICGFICTPVCVLHIYCTDHRRSRSKRAISESFRTPVCVTRIEKSIHLHSSTCVANSKHQRQVHRARPSTSNFQFARLFPAQLVRVLWTTASRQHRVYASLS